MTRRQYSVEAQPRLAWGVFEKTQMEFGMPLRFGQEEKNGNGDIQVSILQLLEVDRPEAWLPGIALEAEFGLPTGKESQGFKNRLDAGLTWIMKKDVGSHSFHFNGEFDWTGDQSEKEEIRKTALSVVLGHDMPMTEQFLLVSDLVWQQSDDIGEQDIWLFETGTRAQLSQSLIAAIGVGIGLNRGQDTPGFTLNLGFQLGV